MFQMCMNALQTEAGIRRRLHPRSLSSLPEFCIRAKYRALHEQHSHTTGAFQPTLEVCAFLAKHHVFDQPRSLVQRGTFHVFFSLMPLFTLSKLDFAIRTKKQWTEPERFLLRWVWFISPPPSVSQMSTRREEDEEDEEVSIIFNMLF